MVINKTLIIPLKEESEEVLEILSNFLEYLKEDTELIVVLDTKDDPTYKLLENTNLNIQILINKLEPGASNAINYGIKNLASQVKHL